MASMFKRKKPSVAEPAKNAKPVVAAAAPPPPDADERAPQAKSDTKKEYTFTEDFPPLLTDFGIGGVRRMARKGPITGAEEREEKTTYFVELDEEGGPTRLFDLELEWTKDPFQHPSGPWINYRLDMPDEMRSLLFAMIKALVSDEIEDATEALKFFSFKLQEANDGDRVDSCSFPDLRKYRVDVITRYEWRLTGQPFLAGRDSSRTISRGGSSRTALTNETTRGQTQGYRGSMSASQNYGQSQSSGRRNLTGNETSSESTTELGGGVGGSLFGIQLEASAKHSSTDRESSRSERERSRNSEYSSGGDTRWEDERSGSRETRDRDERMNESSSNYQDTESYSVRANTAYADWELWRLVDFEVHDLDDDDKPSGTLNDKTRMLQELRKEGNGYQIPPPIWVRSLVGNAEFVMAYGDSCERENLP